MNALATLSSLALATVLTASSCTSGSAPATNHPSAENAVLDVASSKSVDEVYEGVKASLQSHGFMVMFEVNIHKGLAGQQEKLGADYNRSGLTAIRSLVFCSPVDANAVSNQDVKMMALCPLRLTLVEQEGKARALFVRPSFVAGDSAAAAQVAKVEARVEAALREVL